MSGVPAVYYHGTGSENASRAYTETPMQHVQRTALRKKCMRSTFTLDCGKKKEKDKKEHAFFPFSLSLSLLPARLRDSLLRSSLFHVSPFNFNSFSSTLSLSLCLSLSLSRSSPHFFSFHVLAKHRSLSLQFIGGHETKTFRWWFHHLFQRVHHHSVRQRSTREWSVSVPRHWSRFMHFRLDRSREREITPRRFDEIRGREHPWSRVQSTMPIERYYEKLSGKIVSCALTDKGMKRYLNDTIHPSTKIRLRRSTCSRYECFVVCEWRNDPL